MDTIAKREELLAALPLIEKELAGLHDWEAASISDELRIKVQAGITNHERRRTLIYTELEALDDLALADSTLIADGYPVLEDILLTQSEFDERNEQLADFQAAADTFSLGQGEGIIVSLSPPHDDKDHP